jgi:DNA-binding beta-propeller fold protein YncE
MRPTTCAQWLSAAALSICILPAAYAQQHHYLLNGLDEKVSFDDSGKPVFTEPGHDLVSVMEIGTDPAHPRIVANLPLTNSIFGPPVNLQVTPDESLALVANSMQWIEDGGKWKPGPDNKLYVIDLRADPPALRETLEIGRQPSGLAINHAGDLALVANRADKSVSVLAIADGNVRLVDTVPVDDEVAAVAITADGKRALAVKNTVGKVAVLDISGHKVTYDKSRDMPVGQFPYNIDITPDGRTALVAHTGNGGRPDGNADPLAVIDLTREPPRVVDYISAGDAPEAFAISPSGKIAGAVLLGGVILPKDHWAYKRNGSLVVLKIDGTKLTKIKEIELGALPEGIAFSADGSYMYVSSFFDRDVRVFRVNGTEVTDTGIKIALPGRPGSMRARAR